ncbi:Cocaine esterase [Chlamydiales bacterium SCGC AG-110-P3]|nr:Cocaine esterase [Chlamydiales bacterium SCGC AG-110-P3]
MRSSVFRFYSFLILCVTALNVTAFDPSATIEVPMRDGCKLSTDIYLPSDGGKNVPLLLVRSPAGRTGPHLEALVPMAQWGYVVAIQDTRSAMDPEGKTMPYIHDAWGEHQDGFDSVEWLSKSEWCDGKVGTVGTSALGITQLLMAPSAPPALKAQYVRLAAPCLYNHAIYSGGRLSKERVEGWLSYYAGHPSVLEFVKGQSEYNDFWAQFNAMEAAHRITAPAVHLGGWYDIFLQGTIDAFISRQENGGSGARESQKLVIGPWTHFWPMEQRFGDFMVPEVAMQLPDHLTEKAWFDHHLKGIDTGVMERSTVAYYVMGALDNTSASGNEWRYADQWPIPSTNTPFYLMPNGALVGTNEDASATLSFTHDPENPVPTVGGRNLFMESGPKDQTVLEQRDDVLVFTSAVLDQDLEVTGRLSATLYLDTDVDDTDVAVRLCDVYPDGRSILVADGLQKVQIKQNALANGSTAVNVDLASTSQVFAKGHRIRVSVAGSNYPCFEKSDNGGKMDSNGKSAIAHSMLRFSKEYPSQILLPIPSAKQGV